MERRASSPVRHPIQVVILSGAGDFTKVKSLRSRKAFLSEAEGTPTPFGFEKLGDGTDGTFPRFGRTRLPHAKVRAAINSGPPSELQDTGKACRLGVPPIPPLFGILES